MKNINLFLILVIFQSCSINNDSYHLNENNENRIEEKKRLTEILNKSNDIMQMSLNEYKVYIDDIDIVIDGKRFFITHGDGILSWDHGYRILKRIIRSKFFITIFRWIHPTIAYKIARFISRSGKEDTHEAGFNKSVRIELQNFAKKQFDNGFDYMISGHYHLGEIYNLNKGKLAVLGDWFHRPSYAKFDGKDLSLSLWEKDV